MAKDKASKIRIDQLLTKRAIVPSREKAQALILAGRVLSGDRLYNKPGELVSEDIEIRIKGDLDQYVSRGAYKLKAAMEAFQLNLKHKVCLDVGASTGGFTQICLEYGAEKVYAVDVGHNQLDWLLRNDARVISMEGVNVRYIDQTQIPEKIDFVCIDASFISLKLLIEPVIKLMKSGALLVALIKPQHEVGKEHVGKGGIVRDESQHDKVNQEISAYLKSIGLEVIGLIESPIRGQTGNKEFLIAAKVI